MEFLREAKKRRQTVARNKNRWKRIVAYKGPMTDSATPRRTSQGGPQHTPGTIFQPSFALLQFTILNANI